LIHDGAASAELAASLKKREKGADKVASAAARCFTIAWRGGGERGAWDLELDAHSAVWGCSAADLKACLLGFFNAAAALSLGGHADAALPGALGRGPPKKGALPTARKRQLSLTGGDLALDLALDLVVAEAAADDAAARADDDDDDAAAAHELASEASNGKDGPKGPNGRLTAKAFGHNYLCRERAEGDASDEEVDLSKDPNLPYPAAFCAGYSCHGVEPKFSKAGFEVGSKVNQDRGCVVYPFCGRDDMAFFCAMDGHGTGGEKISEYAIQKLPGLLAAALEGKGVQNIERALKKAFLGCDAGIRRALAQDALYAGTTVVACLVVGKDIYTANCGDSRAVVCGVDPNDRDRVVAKDLSTDHKPDLPGERARILQCGGWVSDESEADGPARVWLDRKCNSVGLAMARSFGDHVLGKVPH
jgi:serine/threonine protein phosphatase PrpC